MMPSGHFLLSRSESLPEVPWVMGDPSSSYKWQVSVAGKGKKKGKDRIKKPKKLKNIVIKITLKVKRRYLHGNIFTRLLGGRVKEDFNPIMAAETLLRGLGKAKFKSIMKLSADGKVLYEATNNGKEIRDIIQILKNEVFEGSFYDEVKISSEHKTGCIAKIHIRKKHSTRKAPITIRIDGKIKQENLNRLISYIKKHLPVESLRY